MERYLNGPQATSHSTFFKQPDMMVVQNDITEKIDFKDKEKIGGGSFGEVYKISAKDQSHKYLAVKEYRFVVNGCQDSTSKLRFETETKFLHNLKHVNIAKLLGAVYSTDGKMGWVLLAYHQRRNLLQFSNENILIARRVIRLIIGVNSALMFLHGMRIYHQDVKPHNVLVDDTESSLLTDFGLAGRLPDNQSGVSTWQGTPGYLGPEYAKMPDERPHISMSPFSLDMYGLGVTLWQLLYKRDPTIFEFSHIEHLTSHPGFNELFKDALIHLLTNDPGYRWSAARLDLWYKINHEALTSTDQRLPVANPGPKHSETVAPILPDQALGTSRKNHTASSIYQRSENVYFEPLRPVKPAMNPLDFSQQTVDDQYSQNTNTTKAGLNSHQAGMTASQETMGMTACQASTGMTTSQTSTQINQSDLKINQSRMKLNQGGPRANSARSKADQTRVKSRQPKMKQPQSQINDPLSNIFPPPYSLYDPQAPPVFPPYPFMGQTFNPTMLPVLARAHGHYPQMNTPFRFNGHPDPFGFSFPHPYLGVPSQHSNVPQPQTTGLASQHSNVPQPQTTGLPSQQSNVPQPQTTGLPSQHSNVPQPQTNEPRENNIFGPQQQMAAPHQPMYFSQPRISFLPPGQAFSPRQMTIPGPHAAILPPHIAPPGANTAVLQQQMAVSDSNTAVLQPRVTEPESNAAVFPPHMADQHYLTHPYFSYLPMDVHQPPVRYEVNVTVQTTPHDNSHKINSSMETKVG